MEMLSIRRVFVSLALPPVLFFLVIVAFSIYFGVASAGDAAVIAAETAAATSVILVVVQLLLLGLFGLLMGQEKLALVDIGWRVPADKRVWVEVGLGTVVGVALAGLYLMVLSPLMTVVQTRLGDYVPAGELLPSLGSSLLPFFIANVLLAPFVEENIYRGYALTGLAARLGTAPAVLVSMVFFGLLHWAGGFWYMVLTGVVAGGVFTALFCWRKNILAAFAAHLTLNLIEFCYLWLSG